MSLLVSLLPIGAQPALAAAPNGQVIYVGNQAVTSSGYWTTDDSGNVTAYSGEGAPTDNYIHYDTANNTLTLHNATIKKRLDYSDSIQGGTYIHGSAIGVFHQNGAAELTIQLEGTNTIAEVSTGIYVLAFSNSTGDASLTITGNGSLNASGSQSRIQVRSNGGDATLSIKNAKVTATASSSGYGVLVQAQNGSDVSLTVDGGSLTASGDTGIRFRFGLSTSDSGTPSLNVSNNAIVRAKSGISDNSSADIQIGADSSGNTSGIVFDGGEGTVYGSVTLQEDLEIGEGESLKLASGANLSVGDHNVIVMNGGLVDEGLKSSVISRDAFIFPESLTLEYAENQNAMYSASGDITLDENIVLNGDGKLVIYGSYGQGKSGFALTREAGSETATVTISVSDMTADGTYLISEQTKALAVFDKDTTDKTRALNVLYEKASLNKLLPPGTYKGKIVLYVGYTTEEVTADKEVTNVDLDKLWKYEIPVTLTLRTLITEQPENQNVIEGEEATFSVTASGRGALTYQWQQLNSSGSWENIPDATSATYTITDTTTAISGNQYRCVVTSGMDGVVETSEAAMLTVAAASYSISVDPATLDFGSITEG